MTVPSMTSPNPATAQARYPASASPGMVNIPPSARKRKPTASKFTRSGSGLPRRGGLEAFGRRPLTPPVQPDQEREGVRGADRQHPEQVGHQEHGPAQPRNSSSIGA